MSLYNTEYKSAPSCSSRDLYHSCTPMLGTWICLILCLHFPIHPNSPPWCGWLSLGYLRLELSGWPWDSIELIRVGKKGNRS